MCRQKNWNYPGFIWTFLYGNDFLGISGAQFKIKPHAHAPVHQNGMQNDICVHGLMLTSHSRNGDEFQTPRQRGSPTNVEVLAFVILVNTKLV